MSMFYELMMKKRGIPSRYQEVEYIENTGTQWINTGFIPTPNTRVIAQIEVSTTSQNKSVFGCLNTSASTSTNYLFYHLTASQNKWYYGKDGSEASSGSYDATIGEIYDIDFNNNGSILINGVSIVDNVTFNGNGNLCIGLRRGYNNSNYGYFKYRKFQIRENGILVRNFIPVYDTLTNKYGMWESVQGKFYGNDGTGDFAGSIVGYTIVGSPTISDGVMTNFNSSNYAKISSVSDNWQSWEFVTRIKGKFSGYCYGITKNNSGVSNSNWMIGVANARIRFIAGETGAWVCDITSTTTFVASDIVFVKICYEKDTHTFTMYSSVDGISWTKEREGTNANYIDNNSVNFYFGQYANSEDAFDFVDLGNTYIKVNGKLWFNGQEE